MQMCLTITHTILLGLPQNDARAAVRKPRTCSVSASLSGRLLSHVPECFPQAVQLRFSRGTHHRLIPGQHVVTAPQDSRILLVLRRVHKREEGSVQSLDVVCQLAPVIAGQHG